jgi:hypothetical protein
MSDLVGDTSHLTQTTFPFSAVKTLKGPQGAGHFTLTTSPGFEQLIAGRAKVVIRSDSLQAQVVGPPDPTKAVTVYVAAIPNGSAKWPTNAAQILTIGGAAVVQHSTYVHSQPSQLKFAVEVAHQIKPKPQVGTEPEIVYSFIVAGAEAETESYLVIKGIVEVDGVGFVQTWKS